MRLHALVESIETHERRRHPLVIQLNISVMEQACGRAASLAPRLTFQDLGNVLVTLGRAVHRGSNLSVEARQAAIVSCSQRIRAAGRALLEAFIATWSRNAKERPQSSNSNTANILWGAAMMLCESEDGPVSSSHWSQANDLRSTKASVRVSNRPIAPPAAPVLLESALSPCPLIEAELGFESPCQASMFNSVLERIPWREHLAHWTPADLALVPYAVTQAGIVSPDLFAAIAALLPGVEGALIGKNVSQLAYAYAMQVRMF